MNAAGFTPIEYTLSDEEAGLAAYRAGWRLALEKPFNPQHRNPLIAFAAFLVFDLALYFTGAITARAGEAALILAAMLFMGFRTWRHWRLRQALLGARAHMAKLRDSSPLRATIEADAIRLSWNAGSDRWRFADCRDAELSGPLLYLWRDGGMPFIAPLRCFESVDRARELIACIDAQIAAKLPARS